MTAGRSIRVTFFLSALLLWISGCERDVDTRPAQAVGDSADLVSVSVNVDTAAQERLGLSVALLETATYEELVEGQGLVLDPQPVVELMADWTALEAAQRQSRAALERAAALFDADAAGSREALEAAERQAAADSAALDVAKARATIAYGSAAPWLDASQRAVRLAALRDGAAVIVRASFPGRRLSDVPSELLLHALGAGGGADQLGTTELWPGPADPNVPGSVLLAYVSPAANLVAGARVRVTLAAGRKTEGPVIPASAVVFAGASAWCYRASEENVFVRTPVDLSRPLDSGYFQADGFAAGDEVVVAGAGLLLAHELSGIEEED